LAVYVKLKTDDPAVLRLHGQVEKLSLLHLWLLKAMALLQEYLTTLDSLDPKEDKVATGKQIQACESYMIAAVNLFLRCFHDQPSTHLEIDDVTKDAGLLACYKEICELRNDEFVHWKGLRTELTVRYQFEHIDRKTIEFAKDIQVLYSEHLGPPQDVDGVKELFRVTAQYVERRRDATRDKLRSYLAQGDNLLRTKLIDEAGRSMINPER